jgi:hypothetical protein
MILIDINDIYLPVMLPIFAVMLPAIPDMLPVMLPAFSPNLPAIPVMFSANTTVPIAGTSKTAKANAIANDKISVVAIFIRNDTTLYKYFPKIGFQKISII